jgi:hypothetical protein
LITDWRSAKISDFGSSRLLPDHPDELTFNVGTALYMPPEVLKGDTYGTPSDVYSFGCILVDLAMHGQARQLYYMRSNAPKNQIELTERVAKGWRPKLPTKWKSEIPVVVDLIKSCWEHDPYKRPSFQSIEKKLSSWDGEIRSKDLNSAVAHASVYSFEEETFINEGYEYLLEGLAKVKQADKKRKLNLQNSQKIGLDATDTAFSLNFEFTNSHSGGIGVQSRMIPFGAAKVANFIVQFDHPFRELINLLEGVEKFRRTTYRENEHNAIFQIVKIFPPPLKNREFLMRQVWKRISQGIYMVFAESVDHPSCPIEPQTVRATCRSAILIQDIPGTSFCRVTNRFSLSNLFGAKTGYLPNMMTSLATHKDSLSCFLWLVEAFLTREQQTADTFVHPTFSQRNQEKNAKFMMLFDKAFGEYLKLVPEDQRKQERVESKVDESDFDDSSYGSRSSFKSIKVDNRSTKGYLKSWANTTTNIVDYKRAHHFTDDKDENSKKDEPDVKKYNEESESKEREEAEAEAVGTLSSANLPPDDEDSQPWANPRNKSTRERRRSTSREKMNFDPLDVPRNIEALTVIDAGDKYSTNRPSTELKAINSGEGLSGDEIV